MLRTALILLVTFVALGGAFTLYLATQPATRLAESNKPHPPAPPLPIDPGEGPYKNGGAGDLKQYNKITGRISSIMSWNSFTRHKDGTTTVIAPVMSFYVGDGQRLMIVGETGQIDDFHAPAMTAMTSTKQPVGMPDRGTLQHVHIYLYPTWDNNAQPTIILTTENLAFDNATFRIATAGYTDEQGNSIAADQVPVHVTGDYLFDGRGLTVQWNDRDNRLELLEVEHGEQLTILHPKDVFGSASTSGGDGKTPAPSGGRVEGASAIPGIFGRMLASTDRAATAMALPAARPAKSAKPPQPPYLARFFENLVITQGLETKVTGDTMDVGFVLKQSNGNATTRPSKPASGGAAGAGVSEGAPKAQG
ncbi:MAG TPA: hypothetical protein VHY37_14200, partial [Tepidisphaeraceae bacterium]|nr:hypothetical protein [Tepidisphaeraceae bacterium]